MAQMTGRSQNGVERTLGRIEGANLQILAEIKSLRDDFAAHSQTDLTSFAAVRSEMKIQFDEATKARNQHLGEQDVKLDKLKQDNDRAKGAGKVILAAFAALVSFLGASVIAVLSGWVRFHA